MAIQIKRVDPASVDPAQAGLLKLYGNDTTGAIEFVDEDGTVLVVTSAVLGLLAALTPAADKLPYFSGSSSAALTTLTSFVRTLLDDPDAATALATLGAAPLASPAFTGNPTAPNQTLGDNSTKLANTAFVAAAIAALINSAPGALDTLKELADALGDDANFASTITTLLAAKAPLANPTFTGHVDVPTPTTGTDAATKGYVDALVGGAYTADEATLHLAGAVFSVLAGGIGTTQLAALAVTAAKIANATITGTQLASDIALPGNPTTTTQATSDNSSKLATTAFVQALATALLNGLSWKLEVRARTTAALAANTYNNGTSGVGATLTGNSNGALAAQDGVTLVANDRLLVGNEATPSHNGIYTVTQVGDGSHPYILTRTADADEPAELVNATCYVSEGTTYAETQWTCSADKGLTVGTTSLPFAQSGGGGSSPSRATVTKTTGSLANNSNETGSITLAKGGIIYFVTVDRDCWVRLYATAADQSADASRVLGASAPATTNILFEESFGSGGSQTLRRLAVPYYNGDGTPATSIYYNIVNKSGSTSTVQVQITHLPLES